jgi:hypothetical protein
LFNLHLCCLYPKLISLLPNDYRTGKLFFQDVDYLPAEDGKTGKSHSFFPLFHLSCNRIGRKHDRLAALQRSGSMAHVAYLIVYHNMLRLAILVIELLTGAHLLNWRTSHMDPQVGGRLCLPCGVPLPSATLFGK